MSSGIAALLLAGCGGDDDRGDRPTDTPAPADTDTDTDADSDTDTDTDADTDTGAEPAEAFLRLAHVAPELGPLDVYVDDRDTKVLGPVTAATGTPFSRVLVGDREVRVVPVGGGASDAFAVAAATLEPLQRYSAIAWGTAIDPALSVVHEDAAGLAGDHVRYTVFGATEGLPDVDVIDPTGPSVLGTGTYGVRTVLAPDLPQGARVVDLDLDRDGAADCGFVVPNAGGHVVVPLFVTLRQGEVQVLALDPQGAMAQLIHADPGCPWSP